MARIYIIGIDLGGTNVKLGLLDAQYTIKSRAVLSTRDYPKLKELVSAIASCAEKMVSDSALKKSDVLGVGIGVPGPTDAKNGIVHFLPNIPGWKNVPLKRILQNKLKLPVFVDNDAKLMTLAEYYLGYGRKFSNVLCVTLGTGVGGGIVLGKRLYRGQDNAAGEIGHVPLNQFGPGCSCGGIACIERYVGNAQVMAQAKRLLKRRISLVELSLLAKKKNRLALKVWDDFASNLGATLAGVVNLLNLDAIIIGGGVADAGKFLFDSIEKTVKKRSMSVQGKRVKILKAKLGNDAGIKGAALLVREGLHK